MSYDSSTKYYQNNKEKLQKMHVKDIKAFIKNNDNDTKNLPEDEKQKLAE